GTVTGRRWFVIMLVAVALVIARLPRTRACLPLRVMPSERELTRAPATTPRFLHIASAPRM
ncbi:hypothetical protein, partial [Streptomyces sp. MP131-18]|uniref:hypothetical protein n=1 Tax=Streptomyces sp. MP131-18 TaxID=1857892 RepID=UPI00209B71A5